jgi:hypothetical protein
MALLIRLAAFWLLLSLLSAGSAFAQITITEGDLTATVGQRLATQSAIATSDAPDFEMLARTILDQSGANQTYDLRPFTYEIDFEGIQERRPIDQAPDGVPFLDQFIQDGAEFIAANQLNIPGVQSDSTVWSFDSASSEDGLIFHGISFESATDVDGDGQAPDQGAIRWNPGRLEHPLPLSFGDTWEQSTEFTFLPNAEFATSEFRESEVDGWGTLITPSGSIPVLRIRTVSIDTVDVFGFLQISRSTEVKLIARDYSISANLSYDDETDSITDLSYTVFAEAGESYTLSQGETPTLTSGELGTRIQFTQGSSTAGTLDIFRYDTSPFNNTFSGSANSDDGSTITPNTVWQGWYVSIRNLGLQNFATDVCLDISGLGGVLDASKLVLLRRGTSDDAWTALASFLSGDFLCSSGVTGFSQFAVGSNSDTNPLPVELTRFTAEADGRDALLQWETATETNNAGFAVEHRAPEGAWRDVQFVEGAGTTTEATRYAFRVRDLAVGTHAFRLRQTDLDGTTQRSAPQVVAVRPASAFVLTTVDPHPVRGQGTLRLAVEETQDVTVEVFDVLGRRVQTLHSGPVAGGSEVMLALDASALPNGFYLVRAAGAQHRVTHRITVLK